MLPRQRQCEAAGVLQRLFGWMFKLVFWILLSLPGVLLLLQVWLIMGVK